MPPELPQSALPDQVSLPPAELLAHFESLGENCELGFVQRRFGCEPISLLRWAYLPFAQLVAALDADFAGVGEPDFTDFFHGFNSEYQTRDKRYVLCSHTFLMPDQVPDPDAEFRRQCARIRRLRRALLENLEQDRKILVCWAPRGLTDADCARLSLALRRHGARKLLCVRASAAQAGRVLDCGDGVLVGHVRQFSQWPDVPASYECWVAICRAAFAIFRPAP